MLIKMVISDPEITRKLAALGISTTDLKKALLMIRDFRIQTLKSGIDPKATRIALLFAELSDCHFAQQKLTNREMKELKQIAKDLFNHAKPKEQI